MSRADLLRTLMLVLASAALLAAGASAAPRTGEYQQWIVEMKESPRGPFAAIKWFCKDGRVLPPSDYACSNKGQGWQHGEWSDRAKQLRSQGYKVANVLAGIDAQKAVAAPDFADTYAQLLIEKFLIAADDGWIMRKAQFYRGAIQEEDEREAARSLLTAMATQGDWIGYRYPALRAGVRLLPHGADTASAQKVRNMAAAIADRDPAFQTLRVKIHGSPDASDAASVREYAAKVADPALKQQADALAAEIDRVYAPRPLGDVLEENAKAFTAAPSLQKLLIDARADYAGDSGPEHRYRVTARLLADLRDALPKIQSPAGRLRVLDLSLAVEAENFRASAEARSAAAKMPRGSAVVHPCRGSRGRLRHRDDQRPRTRRAPQGVREALRRPDPARRLPSRVALSRPRSGMGHAGAAHAFRRGDGQARRDRAAGRVVHPGSVARQPAPFLLADARRPVARREPARGRAAQAAWERHRHRIQCAEPRAGTRIPARIARHEARRRLPAGRHLRAAGDRRRPAAAGGHSDGGRRQSALACPASRAQPRHPERRRGPVAAAAAAPERRQAHRACRQPRGSGRDRARTVRAGTPCSARRRGRTRTSCSSPISRSSTFRRATS